MDFQNPATLVGEPRSGNRASARCNPGGSPVPYGGLKQLVEVVLRKKIGRMEPIGRIQIIHPNSTSYRSYFSYKSDSFPPAPIAPIAGNQQPVFKTQKPVGPCCGSLNLQVVESLNRSLQIADIKRSKFGVLGRCGIESHRVHDLFNRLGVSSPQSDTPLPVVIAGRGRN